MFELRTALSYLVPKRCQLSVSVVGLLAVLVIQAITWLVLVFFSTTEGFENRWTQKIVSILGPLRIVPSSSFYDSPQQILDTYSHSASFLSRRLSQKAEESQLSYNPSEDPPLPKELDSWLKIHARDPLPVHTLVERLQREQLSWRFFESTIAHLTLPSLAGFPQKSISQYSYVIGFDSIQSTLSSPPLDFSPDEFFSLLTKMHENKPEWAPILRSFVRELGSFDVVALDPIEIPESSLTIVKGTKLQASLNYNEKPFIHLVLPSKRTLELPLEKEIPPLILEKAITKNQLFLLQSFGFKNTLIPLHYIPSVGYPVLLSKAMRFQGIHLFDTGFFQLGSASEKASSGIPFYVAGFFDPGILPIGGKLVITSRQAVLAIQPELSRESPFISSGIVLDINPKDVRKIKTQVQNVLGKSLSPLFSLQEYNQTEFTSDLYQQLSSEKLLFRMLSFIIIAVACSNIFSMLFILAHDRRKEIAVMRALGASRKSIILIFLFTGLCIGVAGSLFGSGLACITLHYLPEILTCIGKIQGHELLSASIYGEISSQALSVQTFIFTLVSVSLASAIAGSLAAMRACHINISDSLKGGG